MAAATGGERGGLGFEERVESLQALQSLLLDIEQDTLPGGMAAFPPTRGLPLGGSGSFRGMPSGAGCSHDALYARSAASGCSKSPADGFGGAVILGAPAPPNAEAQGSGGAGALQRPTRRRAAAAAAGGAKPPTPDARPASRETSTSRPWTSSTTMSDDMDTLTLDATRAGIPPPGEPLPSFEAEEDLWGEEGFLPAI